MRPFFFLKRLLKFIEITYILCVLSPIILLCTANNLYFHGFCHLLFHSTQTLNAQNLLEVIRTENIIHSNPNPQTIIVVSLNLTDYAF